MCVNFCFGIHKPKWFAIQYKWHFAKDLLVYTVLVFHIKHYVLKEMALPSCLLCLQAAANLAEVWSGCSSLPAVPETSHHLYGHSLPGVCCCGASSQLPWQPWYVNHHLTVSFYSIDSS